MTDSQRPPGSGSPEIPDLVPDLGLDLIPTSARKPAPPPSTARPNVPVAPASRGAAAPQSAPQSKGGAGAMDYFGAGTFDDNQLGGGVGPTIDLGGGSTPSARRNVEAASFDTFSDDLELGSNAGGGNSARGFDSAANAPAVAVRVDNYPTGRTPERETLRVDEVEVTLVADYGVAPKAIWLAPGYSYRVLSRQRVLKQKLAQLGATLEEVERKRDDSLGSCVIALRPLLERDNRFERLIAPIRDLEGLAAERTAALDAARANHGAQLGEFDGLREAVQSEIDSIRLTEAEQVKAHSAVEQQERRLAARVQRLQIEIRNVLDAAQKLAGPTGENVSGAHAQKLDTLRAELAPAEAELEKVRRDTAQARSELDKTRREIAASQKKINELDRQKQSVAKQHEKQVGVRAQGVVDAETNRRKALSDVGRAVLDTKGEVPLEPATLDTLRGLDEAVARALKEHEKYVRALDSFDPVALKLGYKVAGAAAAVLLLLILLKILL